MSKRWAKRLGITVEEFRAHIEAGEKWCPRCEAWRPRSAFGVDNSRDDGLLYRCKIHHRVEVKRYRYGSRHMVGRKASAETRRLMSESRRGERNAHWKGGVTPAIRRARQCAAYNEWRTAVFERDGYLCQDCRDPKNRDLRAHHIRPFRTHPELRYEVANGLTLCRPCHDRLHYGL